MPAINPVSGGSQPVFATDVRNGTIAQTANIAAQGAFNPAGPKLDYFSVTANASVATAGGVNGYVANVIQAVQQEATVAIFQVGAANTVMNFAIYPSGTYTTTTFVAACQLANAAIGIPTANVANTATFTTI